MNTKGHHGVADEVGLPLLEEAFGDKNRSLGAFYLGNWLTDLSQVIDPVALDSEPKKKAAAKALDGIRERIERTVHEIIGSIWPRWLGDSEKAEEEFKQELRRLMELPKQRLFDALDFFLKAQTHERDYKLAEWVRSLILVKGYFKFVHPERFGGAPRMDFQCFMAVFGRPTDTRGATAATPALDRPGAFTQYYPHEHLDRPEVLPPKDPAEYRLERDLGTRSRRKQERLSPDLYSFLRDDIECTAGLLAELDLEFQEACRKAPRETDPAWHVTLAKLGHSLHQVEDFFAHSNWTELAAKRLGGEFFDKVIPPKAGIPIVDRRRTVVEKRLKRYLPQTVERWTDLPDEDFVVTGFFDLNDTLISLLHLGEEVFGYDAADPYGELHDLAGGVKETIEDPSKLEYQAQKALRDALEFLTDPKRAIEDRGNTLSKKLKDKYGDDAKKIMRPGVSKQVAEDLLKEASAFKQVPPEIQRAVLDVIVEGSRAWTIGKSAVSLYQLVRDVSEFFGNPVGWIAKALPGFLRDKLKEAVIFYAREKIYDMIGMDRVGCHSLMAKDHGKEPFFEYQRNAAAAVHWYVVSTLLRWKEPGAGKDGRFVEWLELLEYFLRNPQIPKDGSGRIVWYEGVTTVVHVTRKWEQLKARDRRYSIEDMYRATAADPRSFGWRAIADANFATGALRSPQLEARINRMVKHMGGFPVGGATDPAAIGANYAFREGTRLLIPGQRIRLPLRVPAGDDPTWFREVFDKGWEVFPGYDDPSAGMSQPPLKHHSRIAVTREELDLLISRGKMMRRTARSAYRPTVLPAAARQRSPQPAAPLP